MSTHDGVPGSYCVISATWSTSWLVGAAGARSLRPLGATPGRPAQEVLQHRHVGLDVALLRRQPCVVVVGVGVALAAVADHGHDRALLARGANLPEDGERAVEGRARRTADPA